MNRILLLGLNIFLFFSCSNDKFKEIKEVNSDTNSFFKDYNETNFNNIDCVLSSFVGDYMHSILCEESKSNLFDYTELTQVLDETEKTIVLESNLLEFKEFIKTDYLCKNYEQIDALEYIISQSKNYNFTLINERHSSAQNRLFTKSLLKPLWDQGYRFLALEGLGYKDEVLQNRGYPIKNSGYYTNETTFGNLIREALKIGYILVPYEIKNSQNKERDHQQALNIYQKTFKDKMGKVLIHAGYSHINEKEYNSFKPMGSVLKKMISEDILTIEQTVMYGFINKNKLNTIHEKVIQNFEFKKPIILKNKVNNNIFVDPINYGGVDIQIFYPPTTLKNNRPIWLYCDNKIEVILPRYIEKFSGYLIEAIPFGDTHNAIPVDRFVIGNKNLILDKGKYLIKVINAEGVVEKLYKLLI